MSEDRYILVIADNSNEMDIEMGSGEPTIKKSFLHTALLKCAADTYVYVCNAGSGNGTTNPSAGTLSFYIEYIGMD